MMLKYPQEFTGIQSTHPMFRERNGADLPGQGISPKKMDGF